MAKKDISTIISKGTAKQRINLVAEYIARGSYYQTDKEPFLTDAEFQALSDSFKTSAEIKLWNKFNRVDAGVKVALNNLQGLLFELKMHYSDLRGYILVWNTIEASELVTNTILHHIEPEERKKIVGKVQDELRIFFTKVEPDEEGYLKFKVDFESESYTDENGKPIGYKEKPRKTRENTLLYAMNNIKGYAEETAIKFFSWRKALLDVMKENDFNPETYKKILNNFTNQAYQSVIGWDKYLTDADSFMQLKNPFLDKFKSKYNVTPDLRDIEINEEEYNWFRKEFLKDE